MIPQGNNNVVYLTPAGFVKHFVKPYAVGPYAMYSDSDEPLIVRAERGEIGLANDYEGYRRELDGHAVMSKYFPTCPIISSDASSAEITYAPFPDANLQNTRLDNLVREAVRCAGLGDSRNPAMEQLIKINRDIGHRLRRLHDDTYSNYTVHATLDLHDRNILVNSRNPMDYVAIDFESMDRIDVYDSATYLLITELVTAALLYEGEKKPSGYNAGNVDLLVPAIQAFYEGYFKGGPEDDFSKPEWFSREGIDSYQNPTGRSDSTAVYDKVTYNVLGHSQISDPMQAIKVRDTINDILENYYIFL